MTAWIVAALCGVVCVMLTFRLLADRARRKQRGLFGPVGPTSAITAN